MQLAVVIPSRHRHGTLKDKTLKLFPDATVCVAESEAEAYRPLTHRLLLHPEVQGLANIRQWILDHVDEEVVVMPDDDIEACYSFVGVKTHRISAPLDILRVLENAAMCAKAAGARVFGFNQADIREFKPQDPFHFNSWVGGLIGIIGRELRYDPVLQLHDDVDVCLQSLLRHRIIWQDTRFKFANRMFTGKGGNAVARSAAQHDQELAYLKRKWGPHLLIRRGKTRVRLMVRVTR